MKGTLTGQAYLENKYEIEGTALLIYQGAPGDIGPVPAKMKFGDKSVIPTEAVVISRFPKL
jgi:hypothetical protein